MVNFNYITAILHENFILQHPFLYLGTSENPFLRSAHLG